MKLSGIAAEEGDLLLGREDQPHVGVLLVAIEPVLAALVERHHVGAQAGFLQAFALDAGDRGLALGEFLFRASWRLSSAASTWAVTFSIDIEDVDFQVRRFHFLCRSSGVEASLYVVVLGGRVLLQLAAGNVMIGQQQAVRADEGTGAAVVQPHAGETHVVQPLPAWV